jgi:hypothetical protein
MYNRTLARWADELSEIDYEYVHVHGKDNPADALSRIGYEFGDRTSHHASPHHITATGKQTPHQRAKMAIAEALAGLGEAHATGANPEQHERRLAEAEAELQRLRAQSNRNSHNHQQRKRRPPRTRASPDTTTTTTQAPTPTTNDQVYSPPDTDGQHQPGQPPTGERTRGAGSHHTRTGRPAELGQDGERHHQGSWRTCTHWKIHQGPADPHASQTSGTGGQPPLHPSGERRPKTARPAHQTTVGTNVRTQRRAGHYAHRHGTRAQGHHRTATHTFLLARVGAGRETL